MALARMAGPAVRKLGPHAKEALRTKRVIGKYFDQKTARAVVRNRLKKEGLKGFGRSPRISQHRIGGGGFTGAGKPTAAESRADTRRLVKTGAVGLGAGIASSVFSKKKKSKIKSGGRSQLRRRK